METTTRDDPKHSEVAVLVEPRPEDRPGDHPVNQRATGRQGDGEHQRGANRSDEYADVLEMFRAMSSMPAESHEYARARETIVNRCLPLAEHVARRFARRGQEFDDLVQVARLGLVNAVNRFDSDKGDNFVGFAVPTMMGEVRRFFRDHGWAVHVPRRIRDRHVQIGRATRELTQSQQRAPTPSEIAASLGLDRDEVVETLVAADAYSPQSLDLPVTDDDRSPRVMADVLGAVDGGFDHITDREALRPLIAALPERERTVLYLRFFQSQSQSEIAERIGVSQMQVSRILTRTLRGLRENLE